MRNPLKANAGVYFQNATTFAISSIMGVGEWVCVSGSASVRAYPEINRNYEANRPDQRNDSAISTMLEMSGN